MIRGIYRKCVYDNDVDKIWRLSKNIIYSINIIVNYMILMPNELLYISGPFDELFLLSLNMGNSRRSNIKYPHKEKYWNCYNEKLS